MSSLDERTPLNGSAPISSTPARNRTRTQSRIAKIAIGSALALGLVLVLYANRSHTTSESPSTSVVTPAGASGETSDVPAPLINGSDPWSCGKSAYDAGYIKLANKNDDHYFYWFVESTSSDPSKDPLVLWLTGGPGVSSMSALLTENGPCTVNADLSTTANAYSWTNQANVIWLDQPTGVGFSYSNSPDQDADYDELNVGENIYWFLQGFLDKHPEFDGREFFITGESYGGHYVPGAAHYIWQQNKKPATDSVKHINLQGIAIGNGHTDPVIQYQHSVDMAFNRYNVSVLTDEQIEQMRHDSVNCIALTKQCQQNPKLGTWCVDAQQCWNTKLLGPYLGAGRNSYDIRKPCTAKSQVGAIAVCGFDFSTVEQYLSLPSVRDALHVQVPKWAEVNADVMNNFVKSGDFSFSYSSYVADLLNDGIRVLIYAGDADMVCNWAGNKAWTDALEWKGKEGFNAAEERVFISQDPLHADAANVTAGVVKSFENFVFLRVWEAGHMVPQDQPVVSLDMINKFFKNQDL